MTIVNTTDEIKDKLKKSEFSSIFLDNCLNSKFMAIEKINEKIIGACFVGGMLNSNGIEIYQTYQGKGIGKKLLSEVIQECKKRNISFMTGVFKPTNAISIKTHVKIGYIPIFTFSYNETEGKEIVVILPFNKKGKIVMNMLKIFNTSIGNIIFAILLMSFKPFLKSLISFTYDKMPKMDFLYSMKNFEKVKETLNKIDMT